jgi:hypothetical protein
VLKLWKKVVRVADGDGHIDFNLLSSMIMSYKIGGWGKEFFSGWLEK